ncbi:MAG: glutamate 5-kinase [Desulfatibacillaceae bacterium]
MKPDSNGNTNGTAPTRDIDMSSGRWRADFFDRVEKAVVKIGSGVLTGPEGLNLDAINGIADQIAFLFGKGIDVILVSSGAVASGVKKIGMSRRPANIPQKQAAAAVGQAGLIMEYEKAFEDHKRLVAQILLTRDDLSNRRRYLNARNTLLTLLSWGIVPIVNENDTVVVQELKFGDNDNLAAMISHLMDADVLVALTDTEGLYSADPRLYEEAELVPTVHRVTRKLEQQAGEHPGAEGTGGMLSKIRAARKATEAGIPVVVCSGLRPRVLRDLFEGVEVGTFFMPRKQRMASRKCWLAYATRARGALLLDEGAVRAVAESGKSLLPIGVREVVGEFPVGSPVEVRTLSGAVIARGLVNYSSGDIQKIAGLRSGAISDVLGYKSYDEVIHRDNLVVDRNREEEEFSCP